MLRATQVVLEERIADPVLIGRPEIIEERIRRYGLAMKAGRDFEVVDPRSDPRYRDYVADYLKVAGRKGVTPDVAKTVVRTSPTVIGALALHRGDVDALLCGLEGRFESRLKHIKDIVGLAPGHKDLAAMSLVIAATGAYFLADTHVRYDPERRGDRRHGGRLRPPRTPLWRDAEDRADLPFRLRLGEHAFGAEDARRARACCASGRRIWMSTAKCRPIRPSR